MELKKIRLSVMERTVRWKQLYPTVKSVSLPRIDSNSNCLHSELKAVCSETESGYRSGTGNELWNQRGNESERLTSRLGLVWKLWPRISVMRQEMRSVTESESDRFICSGSQN